MLFSRFYQSLLPDLQAQYFFKGTRFHDTAHDAWFIAMEGQEGTTDYERRRECVAACLKNEWYSSDDVKKVCAFKRNHTEHPNELYSSSHLLFMLINGLPRYLDVPHCMQAYASLHARAWMHVGP